MQEEKITYASEYKSPDFFIDKTNLVFELEDNVTRVTAGLSIRKAVRGSIEPLVLDGKTLNLVSLKIDGRLLSPDEYRVDEESLTISTPPSQVFDLECVTEIQPEKNLSLQGLYRSRGMYCTQCEAEGFRHITYYLDRPDILSEYRTTLIADAGKFPVMLSNGNCVEDQVIAGKRSVTWHDPFKKPCYLFALVAGVLEVVEDTFVTQSGREIVLQIFVEDKDLDKCEHAMNSLKAAMRWDEEVYGREYDLDIFMIVAVDDFNMGAMENKGLNIFNTACVLANPETTTDSGFQRVEGVVAHEYFHNWSGNRVTCRDWFQLSLKEGFTVYRDAEFSADMNSRAVKRIEDTIVMRTAQFVEDGGPMAHPVRPDSYIEISNFYTLTIYEKGAEVIRMMANMLGAVKFRQATDLYFDRFDGQAVTCEDFVCCMEEASGLDLQQFRLWYSQAGTPELTVVENYDEEKQQFEIAITQKIPDTPGQTNKSPMSIPVNIALFGQNGKLDLQLPNQKPQRELTLQLSDTRHAYIFSNITEKPVSSLLRNFSAPVKMHCTHTDGELALLLRVDDDGFSRFNAAQQLYVNAITGIVNKNTTDHSLILNTLKQLLVSEITDPAILAKLLELPGDAYLVDISGKADPQAIYGARVSLQSAIAHQLAPELETVYRQMQEQPQDLSAVAIASRSLKNTVLSYLARHDGDAFGELCWEQFSQAKNMTDEASALQAIVHFGQNQKRREKALSMFYDKWRHESLVVNMWLQIQSTSPGADTLNQVKRLMHHDSYQSANPNKIRALIGGFCMNNMARFHDKSGAGYVFLVEQLLQLDVINPQIASRLVTPLTRWKQFDPYYADLMKAELERLKANKLSKDLFEVVSKSLH